MVSLPWGRRWSITRSPSLHARRSGDAVPAKPRRDVRRFLFLAAVAAVATLAMPNFWRAGKTRALRIAAEDDAFASLPPAQRFSRGTRPVIRWTKGDGLDDNVTRAAIGQATRLFGSRVDYCLLTTPGVSAARVRRILSWSTQPVEWRPVTLADNPPLAEALAAANCSEDKVGYWWKWFPERVRPEAPEMILDGDQVIVGEPGWFADFEVGRGARVWVSQDDRWPADQMYGDYLPYVDQDLRLYSGLISLPPGLRFMGLMLEILMLHPLKTPHDGRTDMDEQGVVAATFQKFRPDLVPLNQFPFARAFEDHLDYGLKGDEGAAWGYHFGNTFKRANPHFDNLVAVGKVLHLDKEPDATEATTWLQNLGQWGVPGWGLDVAAAASIVNVVAPRCRPGVEVLEIGTSRGRLSAPLAAMGCVVTTVDRHDRGAAQNLAGLPVTVVREGIEEVLLPQPTRRYHLIVVDMHGNDPGTWRRLGPLLQQALAPGGVAVVNNAALFKIPEWAEETGVRDWLATLGEGWQWTVREVPLPGVAIVEKTREAE